MVNNIPFFFFFFRFEIVDREGNNIPNDEQFQVYEYFLITI